MSDPIDRVKGCPGCGLFLGHVAGCRGVVASYYRYGARDEEGGFMSIEDAEAFLRDGEEEGSLSSEAVSLPDGTVVRKRTKLGGWPWNTVAVNETTPADGSSPE